MLPWLGCPHCGLHVQREGQGEHVTERSPGTGETKGREPQMWGEARVVLVWKKEKPIYLRRHEPHAKFKLQCGCNCYLKKLLFSSYILHLSTISRSTPALFSWWSRKRSTPPKLAQSLAGGQPARTRGNSPEEPTMKIPECGAVLFRGWMLPPAFSGSYSAPKLPR